MSVKSIETPTFDPRHKNLYRLGAIASILTAAFILLAIGAYFIWPGTRFIPPGERKMM